MVITSVSSVGNTNKYAILRMIRESSGTSREEIARVLTLSAPAVSKNVSALLAAGIVYEHGTAGSSIGRKPTMLYYNYDIMYVIGVEIMPQGIRGALANFEGTILSECESPSEIDLGSKRTIENLYKVIDCLLERAPQREKVQCICVASPGCGRNAMEYNLLTDYQQDWRRIDLAELLCKRYAIESVVMNDVELDLIGEHWKGAGRDRSNVLLLKCGDGFACRALIDGKLFSGANGIAGDIGLFVQTFAQGRAEFQLPGALEKRLCMTLGTAYVAESGKMDIPTKLSLKWLVQAAGQGDAAADRVVQLVLQDIAVAMTNTVLVLDPEVVILGGSAAYFRDEDIAMLQHFLRANTAYPPAIRRSSLKELSGVYGCIITAIGKAEAYLADLWK